MAIWDENVKTADELAQQGADDVEKILRDALIHLDRAMLRVRQALSAAGGKAAVVAKLGPDDAAEAQTVYDGMKALVEAHSPYSPDPL